AARIERVRRAVEDRAVLADEMIPRRIAPQRTRGGQGKIGEMESTEIPFQLTIPGAVGQRADRACGEPLGEFLGRDRPLLRAGVTKRLGQDAWRERDRRSGHRSTAVYDGRSTSGSRPCPNTWRPATTSRSSAPPRRRSNRQARDNWPLPRRHGFS